MMVVADSAAVEYDQPILIVLTLKYAWVETGNCSWRCTDKI